MLDTVLHIGFGSNAEPTTGSHWELQVESFKTLELATKRINEIRASLSIQPEKAYDPEDPNADETGHVWVLSVSLHGDADKLYICTDGCLR